MKAAMPSTRRLLLLACTAITLGLAGCGGGGGDGGGGDDGSSGGTLTVEQRTLATGRVADKLEQIAGPGRASPAQWEQLRAWVLTQPEFTDAGIDDETLWARFTDGRYFLYTDNWKPLPGPEAPTVQQTLPNGTAGLRQAAVPDGVPASPDALLLSLQNKDFAFGVLPLAHMADALKERGWNVGSDHVLTLAALRSKEELGFLYLNAHGGNFGPTGSKQYAMITEDEVTVASEVAHADELDDGTLVYSRDRTNWQRLGLSRNPHYAITAKFITKNLKFSPESLVILLSCNSGTAAAKAFRDALLANGAGTVIGWDGKSNPHAYAAIDLLVDRLTGMNVVDPVTPPNRAFNMEDVWAYLDRKGLLITPPIGSDPPAPIRRFGAGFTLLNPVIAEMQPTGTDKLVLYGEFGHAPATVTVGGKEFAGKTSADGKMLEADLGPTDAGTVVVTTRKRKSNPRMLASWRGHVKYVQKLEDAGCAAVFSNTVDVNLHLRADAHAVRDEVDGPVRDNRWPIMPASDTTATWSAAGVCSSGGALQARWSGSGALAFYLWDSRSPGAPGTNVDLLVARIDAVEKRFQLALTTGLADRTVIQTPDDATRQPLFFHPDAMGFVNDGSDLFRYLMPWGTFLPFDASMAVPDAQQQKTGPDAPGEALTIHWGLTVAPAYDDSIGR